MINIFEVFTVTLQFFFENYTKLYLIVHLWANSSVSFNLSVSKFRASLTNDSIFIYIVNSLENFFGVMGSILHKIRSLNSTSLLCKGEGLQQLPSDRLIEET